MVRKPLFRRHRQSGWTLIELLVCIAILSILAVLVAQFTAFSAKITRTSLHSLRLNRTAESLVNDFANAQISEPKSGFVFVSANSYAVDVQEPPKDSKKYSYQVQPTILPNKIVYVVVTISTDDGHCVTAGSQYQIVP
ncbi:MAG TPA: type II secretion system protein [Acidobacteriota bacterium]|nr:type II secretion system protein [Acidobacteriota bacterium]